jgi:hypothetical protein
VPRAPGIPRFAEQRFAGFGVSKGKLAEHELTEQDSSGGSQAGDAHGILARNPVCMNSGRTRCAQPSGCQIVLERNRNPMQRTSVAPVGDLALGHSRFGAGGIAGHCDEAPQPPVEPLDAVEVGLGQLDR